ncbi:hypothetical protein SAMN02746065_10919 [Desulfocicer vacuolatum DSM 3385]|uniref:Phage protein n=1 Tax=Desulfocicer vacuolatum DSM 3385 TaxID=1121400 RepID=A0A1W2BPC2_9BACT|nr:hypothetical protein [Desulfocicer vacuolatum]SMC74654.1 hypothetical protein SAMN02746065_10919 [Desulfocicer vacuolatum DSM 3385]
MSKNSEKSTSLRGKKLKALEALISCDTLGNACEQAGIGRTTMNRYLNEPVFEDELRKAKRRMVGRAMLRLQQVTGDAARALAEICRDKDAPPSARVAAAKEILSSSLKAIEIEDLELRIGQLEKIIGEDGR